MAALKSLAFLVGALAIGAMLAYAGLKAGVLIGGLGAAVLIAWAIMAHRRWTRLEASSGLAPDAPERILWLRLAGNSLILGHAVAALALVGDDLRLGHGNTLAYDSWTLLLGQSVAALVFRRDRNERDERHEAILARGIRGGYAGLIVALVLLLVWLAFAPAPLRDALSPFILANLLIALLLASYGVMLLIQLMLYAEDTNQALVGDHLPS